MCTAYVCNPVQMDGGLTHPNWRENLKFGVMMQKKANELYPRTI